ncbi:expressed unknown protein (Partial), partial [Seminavis robusta]
ADEEFAQAELEEAKAKQELEQSALDESEAGEESTKAAGEEDEATKSWSESVQHGAAACGSAVMMSVASAFALLFWLVRIGGSTVVPLIASVGRAAFSGVQNGNAGLVTVDILHGCSHMFHHVLLFVAVFGVWGGELLQLRQLHSMKSMGGILLGFALSLATIQSLLMHVFPAAWRHEGGLLSMLWTSVREFLRRLPVLCTLVVLEILLLWVNAGKTLFSTSAVQIAQHWWLWVFLLATMTIHHSCFSRSSVSGSQCTADISIDASSVVNCSAAEDSNNLPCETTLCKTIDAVDYGSSHATSGTQEGDDTSDEEWEEIDCEADQPLLQEARTLSREEEEASVVSKEKWFHELLIDDCKRSVFVLHLGWRSWFAHVYS